MFLELLQEDVILGLAAGRTGRVCPGGHPLQEFCGSVVGCRHLPFPSLSFTRTHVDSVRMVYTAVNSASCVSERFQAGLYSGVI